MKVTGTTKGPTKQSQARGSGDLAAQAESGTPTREGGSRGAGGSPLRTIHCF